MSLLTSELVLAKGKMINMIKVIMIHTYFR